MKQFLSYIIFLFSAVPLNAEVIDCTPGALHSLVGDKTGMTSLTVNGQMDVTDFDFIADRMTDLTALVINAEIVSYKGTPTRNGSGISAARAIPSYALFGSAVKDLTISGEVTSIGEAALAGTNLEKLTVTANIPAIPPYMAKDASSLRIVTLPPSVTEIGISAFEGCSALEVVEAPGVKEIAGYAFSGCASLSTFPFSKSLQSIGDYAFSGTALKDVELRHMTMLSKLGTGAFSQCENLETASLPEGVTSLPEVLFFGDSRLVNLTLPESLTEIGDLSLAGLTSMDDGAVLLAATGVETIGDYGIANWKGATAVKLPSSLNYMGDRAMRQWESLRTVKVSEEMSGVPELGEAVWENTSQENITLEVPSSALVEQFRTAPQWKEFNIQDMSGADEIADAPGECRLTVDVSGDMMTVTCSETMTVLELYDLAGHLQAELTPHTGTVTVKTGSLSPVLLRVTTESNKKIATKVIRM